MSPASSTISFHIGDHVKIIGESEITYEILATRSQPHITVDSVAIKVPEGLDFVLGMLDQENKFEPYRYVIGRRIMKVTKS